MEKDFQAFLSRLKLESSELPLLHPFFRSLLLYQYLFPDSLDYLASEKISFISKELQENNLNNLSFILNLFHTTINSSLIDYLKGTDWWWDYLILLKHSRMTIYQLSSVHESTMSIEDKKSSGVYFTPSPQINFICKYSLYKRLLLSRRLKIKEVALIKIIFLQEAAGLKKDDLRLLSQILCNFKVIDPSCGSGLFLYEMNMIVGSLMRMLTSSNIITYAEYQEYLHTFQSNLTGYDINEDHIIFTKLVILSTWMHLRPDESLESVQNFEIRYNELDNIQEQNFLQIDIPGTKAFDLCIGNPPYLRHHEFDKKSLIQSMLSSPVLQNVIKRYIIKFDAKADLYLYFWIKGMILLKRDGVLSFVLSRSWYSSQFMVPMN
ncbi:MAG: Eco57I restriction-modification methylase domain-containing protein, partial [Candidatus Hodarchaeales archaeon]